MSHAHTNSFLDQYEQDVDEIVAACNGDLRGAVKALMLVQRISAELIDQLPDRPPQHLVH